MGVATARYLRVGATVSGGGAQTDVAGTDFTGRVLAVVAATRPGELVTYGEVAAEAGAAGAARAVGRVLAEHGGAVPWWRVVTVSGRLVPGQEIEHARRLRAEGVGCHRGRVAMQAPPWRQQRPVRRAPGESSD